MRVMINLFFSGVLVLAITSGCSAGENLSVPETKLITDDQATAALIKGNNKFALNLYKEVCKLQESDNLFFSPYSVSNLLGMLYSGAEGETALEMADVLHFTLPVESLNRAFHSFTEKLAPGGQPDQRYGSSFTFSTANGLWVQNDYKLLDEFVAELADNYNASVENLDFINDTEGSRQIINSSIAEKTMNRIQNLIPPNMLKSDTRVMLTNAVYFKASWINAFQIEATSSEEFFRADGSVIDVPMMNQTEYFHHAASEEWSAISLGYAGNRTSMLILLPRGNIQAFQHTVDADMIETVRTKLSPVNVHLAMPRFEFSQSIQLKSILSSLGMNSAFEMYADFSGFTGNNDLFISEVIHKAFVKVDESGTEAAAATAAGMALTSIPEPPVEMCINKPFIFLIIDKSTGSIIFMGRVMDPSA